MTCAFIRHTTTLFLDRQQSCFLCCSVRSVFSRPDASCHHSLGVRVSFVPKDEQYSDTGRQIHTTNDDDKRASPNAYSIIFKMQMLSTINHRYNKVPKLPASGTTREEGIRFKCCPSKSYSYNHISGPLLW